jgi:ATP-dependent Clp protease ATP-binding subunit ClpC
VYLPDALADAVRDAKLPVSSICQTALERAVRDVESARAQEQAPTEDSPGVGLFTRFTPRARQAMARAEQAARDFPHNYVGTEHVLLGVIDEGGNLALKVLEALEIEAADLRIELVASMGTPTEVLTGHVPFTPLAKRALEETAKEALMLAHNYIGCEHLLLGLLAVDEGLAGRVLRRMGLELRTTRRAVVTALSGFVHARSMLAAPPVPDPAAQEIEIPTEKFEEILRRLVAIEEKLSDG